MDEAQRVPRSQEFSLFYEGLDGFLLLLRLLFYHDSFSQVPLGDLKQVFNLVQVGVTMRRYLLVI